MERVGEKKSSMRELERENESGRGREGGCGCEEVIKDRNSSDLPPQRCQVRAGMWGSRWAISGRMLAAGATADQLLRAARDVSAGGGRTI